MKFSTILTQGLLLSGIIASPIASNTPDATPDLAEGSYADNSTDVLAGNKYYYKLCFDTEASGFCFGNDLNTCIRHYYAGGPKFSYDNAVAYCSFWCSKVKNINDCRTNKKKFNYHPEFACKDQKYCK
ncbi:putative secreted protein [Wickerhamomyces ciferrii]|uniref:Secreted protein n=1 Tax=Wickerhamomyces ciferrii (strain ATCC 14091 / BCRC 22168 / CBS 111 / JCM 3599 / NBRC 0793 / NRRL Y-1031 F-60-10) TaxID=1206466 RepID=K0KSZ8_WICCF|nr:uncharacterized protein BN7_4068 [Wickerhamomyces ciferrii]CCH44504.1 putative secreted protein [Wickerhamomyces ciferrii]